ncbi:hypothetical protein [Actinopolymorpha pittospori]|uniref:Uncharacterized protein n=1 Tax=Actinopolymorpha pittospori TaxID=648752 RepID=A0A927MQG2_9ACTN|nr:hypothetical protein [Actinopolymorpha pittospori]MBE1604199.1 hypothetical protein [Actinopolymorpha pittospori]
MTEEVGVITGELELRTVCTEDGSVRTLVRYAEALDWYTVRGADARLHDPRDHEALHSTLVNVLHRPHG